MDQKLSKQKPVNLDLTSIRFPITAIVSILHRISGLLVFLAIPVLLWLLQQSLASADQFNQLRNYFNQSLLVRAVTWFILSAFIYHLIAGIRHLLMDLGWGETLRGGRAGAIIVILSSIILALLVGVWLW
jgi:succinate dehydrogenase / fumarate reductase cytochrome b subunit